TATVRGGPEQATLARVEPGDSCGDKFALGIDVGTTTIVAELIDLNTGEAVGRGSAYNAQVSCGADVISRMVFASKGDGLTKLQELAAKTVNGVLESVFTKTGVDPGYVSHVVCAANTVMTHMFLGIDTKNIREAPHAPGANVYPWVRAGELGLDLVRDAYLTFYPCIAGYVGGDVVAGVLASGMAERESLSLLIDIGTNGEIVLGNSDWMISAATSAGPAFEGGGVKYGMRAARGAIDGVRIDAATKEPVIVTIGGVKPVGICGSGLVDLLAELFLSGVVDLKGKFNTGLSTERLRDGKDGPEYVLVWADRTAQGNDIAITQPDVDNLIRAKAAVFAGIKLLSENTGVSVADIDRVYIAGAFGNYLEVDKVVTIGLLPEIPSERFEFIGNGSLIGAELYAFSSKAKGEAEALAEKITYLELSTDPNFMNEYVSAMFLPHTEGGLFPSVAGALRERAGL
ncbi:MAG: ASKHA domain-containing protein, partial [Terriglobia bacterium]